VFLHRIYYLTLLLHLNVFVVKGKVFCVPGFIKHLVYIITSKVVSDKKCPVMPCVFNRGVICFHLQNG
jgi:hypothetical protein